MKVRATVLLALVLAGSGASFGGPTPSEPLRTACRNGSNGYQDIVNVPVHGEVKVVIPFTDRPFAPSSRSGR